MQVNSPRAESRPDGVGAVVLAHDVIPPEERDGDVPAGDAGRRVEDVRGDRVRVLPVHEVRHHGYLPVLEKK